MSTPRLCARIVWVGPVVVGLLVVLGLAIRLFAAPQAAEFHDPNDANDVYEGGQVVVQHGATTTASADKEDVDLKRIEEQLDEILQVQETILAQYEDLMESLRIAKFRVSR